MHSGTLTSLISARRGGWHDVPHMSWGFALHRRSSPKAARGEEWRGENPDMPVPNGNLSKRLHWKGQETHGFETSLRTNIFNRRFTQPQVKSGEENFLTGLYLELPFRDERTGPH